MPTESKSETPRTYTCWMCKRPTTGTPAYSTTSIAGEFAYCHDCWSRGSQDILFENKLNELNEKNERLEKELNKANEKLAEAQQWLDSEPDWKDKFFANYHTLAKENKVMREALEQCHPAKVWDMARQFYSHNVGVTGTDHKENCKMVDAALKGHDPTNPIVLTRNELIAEIEKMPCGCNKEVDWRSDCCDAVTEVEIGGPVCCMKCGYQCKMVNKGEVKIKCHRCQWLARVKGES